MTCRIGEIGTTASVQVCIQQQGRSVKVRVISQLLFTQQGHTFPKELCLKTMNDHLKTMYVSVLDGAKQSMKPKSPGKLPLKIITSNHSKDSIKLPIDMNLLWMGGLVFVLIINALTLFLVVRVLSLQQELYQRHFK